MIFDDFQGGQKQRKLFFMEKCLLSLLLLGRLQSDRL